MPCSSARSMAARSSFALSMGSGLPRDVRCFDHVRLPFSVQPSASPRHTYTVRLTYTVRVHRTSRLDEKPNRSSRTPGLPLEGIGAMTNSTEHRTVQRHVNDAPPPHFSACACAVVGAQREPHRGNRAATHVRCRDLRQRRGRRRPDDAGRCSSDGRGHHRLRRHVPARDRESDRGDRPGRGDRVGPLPGVQPREREPFHAGSHHAAGVLGRLHGRYWRLRGPPAQRRRQPRSARHRPSPGGWRCKE